MRTLASTHISFLGVCGVHVCMLFFLFCSRSIPFLDVGRYHVLLGADFSLVKGADYQEGERTSSQDPGRAAGYGTK